MAASELVVLENVRFNKGEKKDDEALSKIRGALCDVFNGCIRYCAHRARRLPTVSVNSQTLRALVLCWLELDALGKALKEPARQWLPSLGGSKVSTKLTVLDSLSKNR